jgi:hypothetical protein
MSYEARSNTMQVVVDSFASATKSCPSAVADEPPRMHDASLGAHGRNRVGERAHGVHLELHRGVGLARGQHGLHGAAHRRVEEGGDRSAVDAPERVVVLEARMSWKRAKPGSTRITGNRASRSWARALISGVWPACTARGRQHPS